MRRKLVTIRDVAERAGVSVSTVSHVLNGNDQHVGAVKRKLVMEAVDALRYRPNAIARSMVKQKTATIGLVITEIENLLFTPVIAGVEAVLRPTGYHIVLVGAPDVESEVQAIETLRSQQVDGFIFMSLSICHPNDHLIALQEEGVPFVVINRCIEDMTVNQVGWADSEVGYAATSHLISLGHTRIGTLCGPLNSTPARRSAIGRHQGWLQALNEHHLPVVPEWIVSSDYSYEGGYQAAQQVVTQTLQGRKRPTALFVASDVLAVGALKALQQGGLRVPHDIALVATGYPPFAAYTIPALTTLSLPVAESGQVAARILFDWLQSGKSAEAEQTTLSFRLKIRESCGANKTQQAISPFSAL